MSELPPNWVWSELSAVADWGSGGTPKAGTAAYYDDGSIPWAVIGDLTDGPVVRTAATITQAGLENSSAKVVPPGTVLVAMYGSIGKLGLPTVPMATNQAIAFARPVALGLHPRYLFYYLLHERSRLAAAGKGATQQNISQTILRSWPIPIAPYGEQERVVAAIEEQFSRLDVAAVALESARQKLKRMRAAIFRDAFVIGEQTPVEPLAAVVTSSIGGLWGQPSPGDASWVEVAVIRGAEFRAWDARRADTAPRRWVPVQQLSTRRLKVGDLVLEVSGGGPGQPVGRVVLIDQRTLDAVGLPLVTSNFCRRLTLDERVVPRYLMYHLTWLYERGATVPFQKATTNIRNLTVPDYLAETGIVVPDIAAQHAVVERLDALLDGIDRLDQECTLQTVSSHTLRSSVLAAAFSGNLVSHDPGDEPASILLDRIAAERATSNGRARTRARKHRTPREKVIA